MRSKLFILSIIAIMLAYFTHIQPAYAEDTSSFGVGFKLSTLGVGGEVTGRITDNLNLRLGLQGLTYDYDDTYSDIDYDAELDLLTGALLADWYPFGNNGLCMDHSYSLTPRKPPL